MNFVTQDDAQTTKRYLAAIVDSSDDAIISKTLDGIITSWNAAAQRIFGYSAEEAIGQHISLIIPKSRLDEEYIIIGKVRAGQRVEHFETLRCARDGTLVDVSLTISPIHDDDGNVIGASNVARDIRVARSAERTSAYLAAIVESSDDVIVSKNLDGIITSWNAAAQRVFGYTPEEAIGKHITLIIPPNKIEEEYGILAKVKAGQRVDHFETVRRAKDGSLVDLSVTVSPILDSRGRIIGASKVARDIGERKRIEALLEESNRRRDEFMANMSHELRTPLNAVIGLAHILSKSERLNPREQQCVGMIRQSGDTLLALINNLLDYSKAETGSLQLEAIEFDLPETIEKCVMMMDAEVKSKGLELGLTYDGPLREYYVGDPLRLQQIVTNLLANAVKFTDKGRIDVMVALRSEDSDQSCLSLSVADTGVGIPADKVDVIFDKFMQADASVARSHGGSGLGLSICKALAEAMGGAISVQSTPGLGSTFTVNICLAHSARDERMNADTETAEARRNVLVVEDFEPNVLVVSSVLDELGYSYDVATNGMEGVRRVERGAYDLILMDVQMPGMDGFESTRRIRQMESERGAHRTPIVAMTAHVFDRDKHKCLEAGMDDFIPKPFDPKQLESVLSRLINQLH
ncbi:MULTISPECIES: PAS domain-containing hybrid sensor histidine kinase/response regulator [Asticcacaulis]|uniref:PAS domain-containing hybrid sensor histidine kinase/response regulator n=1 Tax=Asticcacaulis TaxID=76890 RepID=UPI001AE4A7B0|nr:MULTISPECIES: PAS domain-containing hybrid sensor histidine kinase/response regulator [Asticcacaulis]MBP2160009.1 PAS domain S-box-containing protein [Asticcacaulis solisilvae]MDR6801054.1 PAS domain S-box-containing protein [Asticcacaulis sp. BE141]